LGGIGAAEKNKKAEKKTFRGGFRKRTTRPEKKKGFCSKGFGERVTCYPVTLGRGEMDPWVRGQLKGGSEQLKQKAEKKKKSEGRT